MDFYINGDVAPGGRFNFVFTTDNATGMSENRELPGHFSLSQNYPNPFNPTTIINYELPARSAGGPITNYVELGIYNLQGQKVTSLVSERQTTGTYKVEWDATGFASGIYYYRLQAGDHVQTKKLVLLR